jgi:hypothetical protein
LTIEQREITYFPVFWFLSTAAATMCLTDTISPFNLHEYTFPSRNPISASIPSDESRVRSKSTGSIFFYYSNSTTMRLLKLQNNGDLHITNVDNNSNPSYAILSHTWGNGADEVTFKNLTNDLKSCKSKAGYRKLLFCGEQARPDNLHHFWVDTCCIDESSSAELLELINSMFRWYQRAHVCYVYFSDVKEPGKYADSQTFDEAFRGSRWFTRGWTLQELLAPRNVKFYS